MLVSAKGRSCISLLPRLRTLILILFIFYYELACFFFKEYRKNQKLPDINLFMDSFNIYL
jgi:hypothetical protein